MNVSWPHKANSQGKAVTLELELAIYKIQQPINMVVYCLGLDKLGSLFISCAMADSWCLYMTYISKRDHQREHWLFLYRYSKCLPPGLISLQNL